MPTPEAAHPSRAVKRAGWRLIRRSIATRSPGQRAVMSIISHRRSTGRFRPRSRRSIRWRGGGTPISTARACRYTSGTRFTAPKNFPPTKSRSRSSFPLRFCATRAVFSTGTPRCTTTRRVLPTNCARCIRADALPRRQLSPQNTIRRSIIRRTATAHRRERSICSARPIRRRP